MSSVPVGAAIRVRAPASSANLGPGFDSIGLALGVWDEVDVEVTAEPGLRIDVSGQGSAGVPRDESHLVYRSMVRSFERIGLPVPAGLHLVARNAVPHGRGMGSSATAIVAGVVAAQGLSAFSAGAPPVPGEAIAVDLAAANTLASDLEGHPDNASASIYGGLTLSWTADPGDPHAGSTVTVRLPIHPDVTAVVFVPETTLATHTARAMLPDRVPLRDAARNSARAALLVEAASRRPDLLVPATRDWLHQEARRPSYAASMALVDHLRSRGFAAFVSGAGPSVLTLVTRDRSADVTAPGPDGVWLRLEPGIPTEGAQVRSR
ncbi:MAG: homoserine kinase [Dermatophilaceae bacterium]